MTKAKFEKPNIRDAALQYLRANGYAVVPDSKREGPGFGPLQHLQHPLAGMLTGLAGIACPTWGLLRWGSDKDWDKIPLWILALPRIKPKKVTRRGMTSEIDVWVVPVKTLISFMEAHYLDKVGEGNSPTDMPLPLLKDPWLTKLKQYKIARPPGPGISVVSTRIEPKPKGKSKKDLVPADLPFDHTPDELPLEDTMATGSHDPDFDEVSDLPEVPQPLPRSGEHMLGRDILTIPALVAITKLKAAHILGDLYDEADIEVVITASKRQSATWTS